MIKIFGVDPGSSTAGVAIFTLDKNLDITAIETNLIDSNGLVSNNPFIPPIYMRMKNTSRLFGRLIEIHKPFFVHFESGFLNMDRPGSIIPLTKSLASMEMQIINSEHDIMVNHTPPTTIKARLTRLTAGAGGHASKDEMTDMVKKIDEITKYIDPDTISEHEVDGLAIGYLLIEDIRREPGILLVNTKLGQR